MYKKNFKPLLDQETEILTDASKLIRSAGPARTSDFGSYEAINPLGVSAAAILDTYNSCMLQPVPTFGADHNYFAAEKAKHGLHKDERCIPGKAILPDGTDVTALVHEAEDFLNEHSFFQYDF